MLRNALALWPLVAAVLLLSLARRAPESTEALYARGVYPLVAAAVALPARLWHGLVGVGSLAEWALVALALLIGLRARSAWRASPRPARALALGALRCAGGAVLVFVLTWGLNHARPPARALLGLEAPAASSAAQPAGSPVAPPLADPAWELAALARHLARLSADARRALVEDGAGVVVAPRDYGERAAAAWRRAAERRPALSGPEARVVEPLASPILVAARVSGVFSPFTGEAHVARGLPAVGKGFAACHELAHGRGFAREDEANGLAFLVGVESGDPYLVHSSAALAFVHVLAALERVDVAAAWAIVAELDPGVARDLDAQRAFWRRPRSRLARGFGQVATAANDAYLRGMGTRDGVASYGRMVDLALGWWRAEARGTALDVRTRDVLTGDVGD